MLEIDDSKIQIELRKIEDTGEYNIWVTTFSGESSTERVLRNQDITTSECWEAVKSLTEEMLNKN